MSLEKIVVFRHAHRDTSDRALDNGLDDKGRAQVEELLHQSILFKLPSPLVALSSPKKRCVETMEPLTKKWGVELQIEQALDEQLSHESSRDFLKRILSFSETLPQRKEKTLVLCSHGDWIPEFTNQLTQFSIDLKKSGYVILEKTSNRWRIQS